MKIISILPEVFQEYPEEISLGVFSWGCNFACCFCHAIPMVFDKSKIIGGAIPLLEKNLNPLHTAVVFSGGEPFIWGSKLIEAVKFVKDRNLKVKIFTNGYYFPDVMEINSQRLVDAYSVDFKGVTNIHKAIGVKEISEEYLENFLISCHNIRSHNIPLEIRVTKHEHLELDTSLEFLNKHLPKTPVILQEEIKYKDN